MNPKIIENQIRDVKFGENVTIYQPVNLYECEIGNNTRIGAFVEIQKNAKIGNNCKVSSKTQKGYPFERPLLSQDGR